MRIARIAGLNHQRSRTLLLALGQLVLIAYVFQVGAFDHWAIRPAGHEIIGLPDSSAHVAHCHGDVAGCADGAGSAVTISPDAFVPLPSPPAPHLGESLSQAPAIIEASILTPSEPPRAA